MYDTELLRRNCALLEASKNLETLFRITCDHGDRIAAYYLEDNEPQSVTFARYRQMTDDYAAYLRGACPQGGYVAIAVDTCKEWFPLFWGVIRSGHDALLIDCAMDDEGTAQLLKQAGCGVIVATKRKNLGEDVLQISAADLFAAPQAADYRPVYGNNVALCTSGTTGQSRVFVYNGQAVAEQVLASNLLYEKNKRLLSLGNRRAMAFLPFHHVLGFMVNLLWFGFLGYANIYVKNRAPETILQTAQCFRPQIMVAVPLLANNLCASLQKKLERESYWKRAVFGTMQGVSLTMQRVSPKMGLWLGEKVLFRDVTEKMLGSELECLILGGSHTPAEHLRTLNALGYYTVCGFGMTETAVTSVETGMGLGKRLKGSVGRPLESIQYRVVGDTEEKDRGEMLVRGKTVHTGRMEGGKLLPPATMEDGWYPTGDIVRQRRFGRILVEGRLKDVIVNESGENVYPDELEDTFSGLEGVEQFSVLGIPKPGKGLQYEDITLVINAGESWRDESYLAALGGKVARLNRRLPTLKRLNRALVTGARLPQVNGVKVKRLALREMIKKGELEYRELNLAKAKELAAAAEAAVAVKDDPVLTKVRALFAKALDAEIGSFSDDAHFIDDLGGDSLQVLSVSLKAEEEFGVLIAAEEYGQCATVNDLTALILQKQSGWEQKREEPVQREPITRFEDAPEYRAFHQRQVALTHSKDGNPYFVCHDSPLRDKSLMAGQEVLNFGSYNYVGMSGRKEVSQAAKEAIDRYGTSASGSRLLAGEKTLHQELEREIAEWKHAESALVCVGGHSTNVTLVGNFCGKNDLIVYDALAHNSIEQGCRLSQAMAKPFPHNDPQALEGILRMLRGRFEKVLIIIEGAYSMDGDIADVPAFVKLKKQYGCFLMVDEAHSSCVIGETGGGVDEYFHLAPTDIDIKMGTLSKGLGACGGYLAGPACIIDYLRYNLPGFVFSVGIPPAMAGAALEAVRQLRQNPQIMADMRRNIACFVSCAKRHGYDICLAGETAVIPVLIGGDEEAFALSNEMRRRGVFVPPAVYPAVPKGKARLRFCVISEHRPEQIEKALATLEEAAQALHLSLPRRKYGLQ